MEVRRQPLLSEITPVWHKERQTQRHLEALSSPHSLYSTPNSSQPWLLWPGATLRHLQMLHYRPTEAKASPRLIQQHTQVLLGAWMCLALYTDWLMMPESSNFPLLNILFHQLIVMQIKDRDRHTERDRVPYNSQWICFPNRYSRHIA